MAHTEREILLNKFNQAKTKIEIGSKYQHTKTGGQYQVLNLAIQEDTEEICVIYQDNHQPSLIWSRRLEGKDGWNTPTEINGQIVPRFTKI